MTEYRHPGSESMGQIVSDLERHRGPGPGKALWRSWLFDGWRFGAVDLSSDGAWPRVVGLACGDVLSRDVQERLVRHLRDRGGLLLLGPVPTRDTRGRACTVLADALGVRAGQRVESSHRHFASVRGVGPAAAWDEMRVDWWQPLTWDEDEAAVPLVEDVGGAVCGLGVEMGPGGRAVVLAAGVPGSPQLFSLLAEWLGASRDLSLSTSVPGVVATTSATSDGQRMLHLLNPTGFGAEVSVTPGDPTGLLDQPLAVPARTGAILALGLDLPCGLRLESSTAELTALSDDGFSVGRGLSHRTELWLSAPKGGLLREDRADDDFHATAPLPEVSCPDPDVDVIPESGGRWHVVAPDTRPVEIRTASHRAEHTP